MAASSLIHYEGFHTANMGVPCEAKSKSYARIMACAARQCNLFYQRLAGQFSS